MKLKLLRSVLLVNGVLFISLVHSTSTMPQFAAAIICGVASLVAYVVTSAP